MIVSIAASRFSLAWLIFCTMFAPAMANQIDLHWSPSGETLWFRQTDSDKYTYLEVDIAGRTKKSAFDHDTVAMALSKELGRPVDPQRLPILDVVLAEDGARYVQCGSAFYEIGAEDSSLVEVERPLVAGNSSRFFRRPRSGRDGGSTNIVVENLTNKPVELFWFGRNERLVSYGVIEPQNNLKQHTFVGHVWVLKQKGRSNICFEARANDHVVVTHDAFENGLDEPAGNVASFVAETFPRRVHHRNNGNLKRPRSPDGGWEISVRNHGLWLERTSKGNIGNGQQRFPLATYGTHDNTFQKIGGWARWLSLPETVANHGDVCWSPDSKFVIAFQTKRVDEPRVHYIESTPDDRTQPMQRSYQYPKPGAELQTQVLRLFSVNDKKAIEVSDALFSNPYSLRILGWSDNSDKFWLLYNERGHKVVRLVEVDATTGSAETVVEEISETFVHYSNRTKLLYEDISAEDRPNTELLWASERTGWNHLYRVDVGSRKVINAITSGNWNVKRVQEIDTANDIIYFYAVGIREGQDPYHEHFCSVNFDGSNFRLLTDGDGTHHVYFANNKQCFVDEYSRVDLAPVFELRETRTGDLIAELQRANTSELFGERRLTERFVAKGRDGKTDIWGLIHWPKDFDAEKKYPVVENIYAGPHDHHVPKSFRSRFYHQHQIADAGMIVVQIDGMGTAWRSKRFHDVCHRNLRDSGFPDRIEWIKAAAKTFPQMDISRVGIYGGSAGGQSAMAALLWHNDFYQVAVADCGCHDNRMDKIWWNEQWMGWPVDDAYIENSNKENAHLLQGHLMLTLGELDRNVDPASTRQVVRELIRHNKEFEFVLIAGGGHAAGETAWAARKRLAFLKRYLDY